MNTKTIIVLVLCFLWLGLAWPWYVCEVRDACGADGVTTEDIIDDSTQMPESAPTPPAAEIQIVATTTLETTASTTATSTRDKTEAESEATTTPTTTPERVVEAPPVYCPPYLTDFIQYGGNNDPDQVIRLKRFLRDVEDLAVTNMNFAYDNGTRAAVEAFQARYASEILAPEGFAEPTGIVHEATIAKINEIQCATQTN